jgi:hypothetical protein
MMNLNHTLLMLPTRYLQVAVLPNGCIVLQAAMHHVGVGADFVTTVK